METPETRYSRSADGVHIAYQVLGDADLDIVLSQGFVSHLEHSWEDPSMARFLRRLASFSRLIVFDKRGTGMSDRTPDDRPGLLEDRVRDIATLMDTVGSERAAIMGLSETGAVALLFAATHPERTRAAVVYGTYPGEGDKGPIYPWAPNPAQAAELEHIERNWGRGAMYLELFAPSLVGDKRFEDWFAKLGRLSVSPGAAVALVRMLHEMDVRDILPAIRVPTLVLHKRDDRVVPIAEGRDIAERVPGAKFVELPGADHWPWIGHEEAVEEIQEFLTGMRDSTETDRALVTVMFLDIVDSTKRAAEFGDRRWTDLLESFYAVVRRDLNRYGQTRMNPRLCPLVGTVDRTPADTATCPGLAQLQGPGGTSNSVTRPSSPSLLRAPSPAWCVAKRSYRRRRSPHQGRQRPLLTPCR